MNALILSAVACALGALYLFGLMAYFGCKEADAEASRMPWQWEDDRD